ncbi:MAG: hypothetical protein HYY20_00055 [Candidatus Tectomicrobia bacterium]|uniref:Uncharacterized protein n=1 Tax=Tectimicrobiota bacterium TaxID=2528274 RepID=A0A932CMB0_UNCTE|nr:hypothetical protein [Candidatus Tectomicrobia bacterium]
MSEGKPYVLETLEICQRIGQGLNEGEEAQPQLQEGKEKLEAVKDKLYLRTQKGTSDAYLVLEAAKALEEACEQREASPEEFSTQLASFISQVEGLHAAVKSRSIVIT